MHFTHAEAFVTEPLPKVINHHIGISGFYEAVHGSERTVTLGLGQHPNGSILVSNAIQTAHEIDRSSTAWGMPAIARALSRYFPVLNKAHVLRTWSMPSPFLPDFLPAIGWLPGVENLFVAAGFHLAIPTIPLLTESIANIVLQKDNIESFNLLKPFSPGRFVGQNNG
jgi:glycine/D-amino acid oxidase-like deaminating enzyme